MYSHVYYRNSIVATHVLSHLIYDYKWLILMNLTVLKEFLRNVFRNFDTRNIMKRCWK